MTIRVISSTQYYRVTNTGAVTMVLAGPAGPAGSGGGGGGDMTGEEILEALEDVDGSGSLLDADLLDGNHAAAFALSGHNHSGVYQPLDADLTALAAANNSTVLAATTAAFLLADESKLDGIEAGAEVNDTASEILTKLLTVDGSGSLLDADLLDGQSSAHYATASSVTDHINDSSAAHAASAISYNGGTGMSATDVEAAIDELATEKADLASPALTGNPTAPTASNGDNDTSIATTAFVQTAASAKVSDTAYDASSWNGETGVAPSKNAVRDKIEDILDGVTFTGDIVVPDEAYDATTWNGSLEVPTKNAIRDKIETLSGASAIEVGRLKPSGGTACLVIPGAAPISVATLTLVADRLYYEPWLVEEAITVDALVVEVTTLVNPSTVRLGIYNADTDWQPTGSIIIDAGTIDSSTGGVKTATITPQVLSAGRYVAALISAQAPTLRRVRSATIQQMNPAIGTNTWISNAVIGSQSGVAAGGLASPGTAWTTAVADSSPFNHCIFARLSAV